jgi:cytochrome c oxidase subunit 2
MSEVDIASVITFQRNSFGNKTGDVVQPIDILKYKQDN